MENKKEKEYTKYKNSSFYILLVILLIVYFAGRAIFQEVVTDFGLGLVWVFILGTFFGSYIFNSFMYELGKIIFGKIANYRLVYTNVFGFTWSKDKDSKTVFSFRAMENYGSGTVMAPKDDDYSKCKPGLYLTGGIIFMTLVDLALLGVSFIIKIDLFPTAFYCAGLMNVLVALIVLILNFAPFVHDGGLDGFYLRLLSIDDSANAVYHNNLLQLDALYTGRRQLNHYEYDDYHGILNISSLFYNYYYYMDKKDEKMAREMIQKVLDHKEYALESEQIEAEKMIYYFKVKNDSIEKVSEEYWDLEKSVRKEIVSTSNLDNIKTALLVSALIEVNYDLYEFIVSKIDSRLNKYQYISRIDNEDELIDETLKLIEKRKPEWFRTDDNQNQETLDK